MKRFLTTLILAVTVCFSGCASFDRTRIQPGQSVSRPGISFVVPDVSPNVAATQSPWSASEFGTGHRIKLNQVNFDDIYSIEVTMTRGPAEGMYQDVEVLLAMVQRYKQGEMKPAGFFRRAEEARVAEQYGALCVQYSLAGEDWRGRNNEGFYALVDLVGLTCAHPEMDNVLVNVEISRRYEEESPVRDLFVYAHELFSSIEYEAFDDD